eukprot:CAMPEP_0115867214 /NCGR_PEP_ID=MMETSP0287-20121206/20652_1 /TAXON_ID=412157 /ORGANISM="Chrysochromulina rotalis, Strain UIO044" /LENGTH=54 /DNA_ID=CAMNT_0003321811 /DNA_START=279 /DNA_END=440 /DNA_ORIENTATION=-
MAQLRQQCLLLLTQRRELSNEALGVIVRAVRLRPGGRRCCHPARSECQAAAPSR